MRDLAFCIALLAGLWGFCAVAQPADTGAGPVAPPLLTLNQERLYLNSLFGQRVRRTLEAKSVRLAAENRQIEAALVAEEQQLTTDRPTMDPEAFRALAEDFDERVTGIRRAQGEKRDDLQRETEAERARFFELAYPVLLQLVQETGALAILNQSAVILSARQIDVTDLAITRINEQVGEAAPPQGPGIVPQPRPEPGAAPTSLGSSSPGPTSLEVAPPSDPAAEPVPDALTEPATELEN